MNYTLNQLQIFLKVTQTESVTKAAEELHLTQPAVSIQLKNFQDQFDIPLTEIIGRRIYITDFGREVAASAEQILNQVNAINYKTQAFKGKLSGRLKISIVSTAKYVMPYFLVDFLKLHPDVDLVMDVTNKSKVINSLKENSVDFSLVSVLPDQMKIQNLELIHNKLYMIGNTSKTFDNTINESKFLEQARFIYREEGSGTRAAMQKFLENENVEVQKKMELTSNEAVKQAVIAGLGYSIMPIIGIRNEIKNGKLQIIPMKNLPIQTSWNLIWLNEKKHSPVAQAYLDYVQIEKQRIIDKYFID